MSFIELRKGTIVLLVGMLILIAGCSDRNTASMINPDTGKHVTADWSNPDIHGAAAKSSVSSGAGFASCQVCHKEDFSGGMSTISCFTCHGVSAPHSPAPWRTSGGSARSHTRTDESNAPVCAGCHTNGANSAVQPATPAPAGTAPGCFNSTLCHAQAGHGTGWANPDVHGAAAKSAPSVTDMKGFSTCQSCHGVNFAGSSAMTCLNTAGCHGASVASPHAYPWVVSPTSTLTHTTTDTANADVCGLCHLGQRYPPSYVALTQAVGCFDNTLCHGAAADIGCVTCHASVVSAPQASIASGASVTQRRAVLPEFQQASNHVRNKTGGVTNADCAVCHMEGNASDGKTNAAYHKNGVIELRDPDTGTTIKEAVWSGTGAGSYASTATDVTFVRFSRNLSSATIETAAAAIMINQCLHCHDADGALNAAAQVTGGTAANPFAGTAANMPAGGVLDVASQFSTANRSYHPVLGKQNNGYAGGTRMTAPWNLVTKSATTTVWGPLMTCWDCHAASGATGTQTKTVTAHGSAVTAVTGGTNTVELRGQVWRTGTVGATNNTTLCIICHAGYDTNTGQNHGTGSAFNPGSTDNGMVTYLRYACYYCHSSGPTKAARPIPAADAHGFETLYTNGTFTAGMGYAFIRSSGFYGASENQTVLSVDSPAFTAAQGQCSGFNGTNGTSVCSRGSMGNYTPGGIY